MWNVQHPALVYSCEKIEYRRVEKELLRHFVRRRVGTRILSSILFLRFLDVPKTYTRSQGLIFFG